MLLIIILNLSACGSVDNSEKTEEKEWVNSFYTTGENSINATDSSGQSVEISPDELIFVEYTIDKEEVHFNYLGEDYCVNLRGGIKKLGEYRAPTHAEIIENRTLRDFLIPDMTYMEHIYSLNYLETNALVKYGTDATLEPKYGFFTNETEIIPLSQRDTVHVVCEVRNGETVESYLIDINGQVGFIRKSYIEFDMNYFVELDAQKAAEEAAVEKAEAERIAAEKAAAEKANQVIEVKATEILKLAENRNFDGVPPNGSTKEIYNKYNGKKVEISGKVEDLAWGYVYLNCNDKGYNSVGANTTLVVYCKVKDPSKYSKGQNVTITGTANCYTYAVVIEE